jgi:hypothetical protein
MLFTSYNRGNNQQLEKIHESYKATTNNRINDVTLATINTSEIDENNTATIFRPQSRIHICQHERGDKYFGFDRT